MSVLAGCGSGASKGTITPGVPAVTAAGQPMGAVAPVTVGVTGGTVVSGDGMVTLVVPAGALSVDTPLSITPLSVTAPGGVRAYRFGPEGTTFSVPASVRFTFTSGELAGSSVDALRVAFQDSAGHWQTVDGSTVDTDSITVATTHLSDWSLLLGWQIRPASASVQPGKTLSLSVRFCNTVTMPGTDLVTLAAECQQDDEITPILGTWAVNGIAEGSSALGTVRRGTPTAIYTAPDKAPSPSTVAVSVEFNPPQAGGRKTLLVSNVSIGGGLPETYSGTLTFHEKFGGPSTSILPYEYRVQAQVTMARSGTGSSYVLVEGTATLLQIDKDPEANCHCTASNIAGMVADLEMGVDTAEGQLRNLAWTALFTVPWSCTPVSCQLLTAPELTVWGLSVIGPPCTGSIVNAFTDPRQITGSSSLYCPVDPQNIGRVEESTWTLQGGQ